MNTLKIKLYGEGYLHHLLEDHDFYKKIADRMKMDLTEALLDIMFFFYLDDPLYQNLQDCYQTTLSGLLNSPKGQIEVWLNRKKIAKIKTHEICEVITLFPLFHKKEILLEDIFEANQIYIEEKEIGMIGEFKLKIGEFSINKLIFHIAKTKEGLQVIYKLTYADEELIFNKKDSLLQRQICYEKK